MKPLNLIFIFCAMCSFVPLGMNDYRADYTKIVAAYKAHACLSFNVTYKSFDKSTTKADTVFSGRYQIKGNKFRSRILGTESIGNDKYYLAIDHNSKMFFLYKASAVSGDFYPISTIDTLIKKKSVEVTGEVINEGKTRRYDVVNKASAYDSYTKASYEFDVSNYLIKKVVMHLPARENVYKQANWPYLNDPFVEFNYSNYSFGDIDESVFSTDKYLSIKEEGRNVQATEAYKGYKIVNSILISQQIR